MNRNALNAALPGGALAGVGGLHGAAVYSESLNPEWQSLASAMLQHAAGGSDATRAALAALGQMQDEEDEVQDNPRPTKRGKNNQNGATADYAMRHQAAEQRRRARINERLEALRKLVPHDPRSNTASFLEDVIKHILMLKDTNEKLEAALLAAHPGVAAAAASRGMAQAGALVRVTPPPPTLQAPPPPPQLSPQNMQQLVAVQQGSNGGASSSGRGAPHPALMPAALVGLAGTGNQALLAQELDAGAVQVQQALMAMQQPGTTAEQQEAILRTFLSNSSALQMLGPFGGQAGEEDGRGPGRSGPAAAEGLHHLLSAMSQMPSSGPSDEPSSAGAGGSE